jgi:hypothetical protein
MDCCLSCRLSCNNEDHIEGVVEEKDEKMNADEAHENSGAREAEKLTVLSLFKYFYSATLLIFSLVVVMSLIATQQTQLAQMSHPAVAFCLLWFLLLWLGLMEGGQASLVGLAPVSKELYMNSHPTTFKSTRLANKGDNMERFIVGRQFLVVLVIFLTNLSGAALPDSMILWLPPTLNSIFVESGIAMMFITVIIGQLTAQVNATRYMLDVINNYFMLYFVTYMSLVVEFSGLLHSVYLVQFLFSKLTRKPMTSNESPRTMLQALFFWIRVMFSCIVLGFAFAVVISALFSKKTTMWEGVPPLASVSLFLVLMIFAGIMEGMQIAFLAVVNIPQEELSKFAIAKKNCDLAFQGSNLQAFFIGRQILVTTCMFVVARIIAPDVQPGHDENIFGVSDQIQEIVFNSNLLGAIITTIASSLIWRVIAASSPISFLSNPLIYMIIRLCLIIDASGLCSAAWMLAWVQRQLFRFQSDEEYIGATASEDDASLDLEFQETVESRDSEMESDC